MKIIYKYFLFLLLFNCLILNVIVTRTCSATGTSSPLPEPASLRCSKDAICLRVDAYGKPNSTGKFVAQCSGRYPDFVSEVQENYSGSRFILSQNYPSSAVHEKYPWDEFDFKKNNEAERYADSFLKYVYDGMIKSDWYAEANSKHKWFHIPWMTTGKHPREFVHGLTDERPIIGPELGLRKGASVNNYAVGYYNATAAYSIGQIWRGDLPDLSKSQLPEGSAVVKLLLTDARSEEFDGPDILADSPRVSGFVVNRSNGLKSIQQLRVLQIDFAIRSKRAEETGWVFGTFAYDFKKQSDNPLV